MKFGFYCYLPEDTTGFETLLNPVVTIKNVYKLVPLSRISEIFREMGEVQNRERGNSQKLHN